MVTHSPFLVTLSLNDFTHPQLNAIPTIGFSDPILSYFSALRLNFDGVRMLNERYGKVKKNPFLICSYPRT